MVKRRWFEADSYAQIQLTDSENVLILYILGLLTDGAGPGTELGADGAALCGMAYES